MHLLRPREGLCVPSGQGCALLAPKPQYEPGGQLSHSSAPIPPWYLPGAHESHEALLATGCALPSPQAIGAAAASGHACPSGHTVQLACDTKPVLFP